jgi:hypothetical protein
MPNTIDDLRKHLFETLDALKDKETPMDLDRARAVAEVAKVLVESAKVEVDFLKVTGGTRSTGFLPESEAVPKRVSGHVAAGPPAGDRCVLCGVRLTTTYLIEKGLCGSCSDRPEAQALKRKPA